MTSTVNTYKSCCVLQISKGEVNWNSKCSRAVVITKYRIPCYAWGVVQWNIGQELCSVIKVITSYWFQVRFSNYICMTTINLCTGMYIYMYEYHLSNYLVVGLNAYIAYCKNLREKEVYTQCQFVMKEGSQSSLFHRPLFYSVAR